MSSYFAIPLSTPRFNALTFPLTGKMIPTMLQEHKKSDGLKISSRLKIIHTIICILHRDLLDLCKTLMKIAHQKTKMMKNHL